LLRSLLLKLQGRLDQDNDFRIGASTVSDSPFLQVLTQFVGYSQWKWCELAAHARSFLAFTMKA